MSQNYDSTISPFLSAVRQYIKKANQFVAANPSPEKAREAANEAFNEVVATLDNPTLSTSLNKLIAEQKEKSAPLIKNTSLLSDILLNKESGQAELSRANEVGLSKTKVSIIIENFSGGDFSSEEINIEVIKKKAISVHEQFIKKTDEARKLSKKEKKPRKRDLQMASVSASFGLAIIAMNAKAPPSFWLSLAAGMAPLGAAVRDIVGTKQ